MKTKIVISSTKIFVYENASEIYFEQYSRFIATSAFTEQFVVKQQEVQSNIPPFQQEQYRDEIDRSEGLWSMSEFVGGSGFGGNFGDILLSLLCALLALLILSVMMMDELNFDDVIDLLGIRYFSLI